MTNETTKDKKSKLSIFSIVSGVVAFLSTVIGVFVFFTGKSDLPSLLSSANIVMNKWDKAKASELAMGILRKELPVDEKNSKLHHTIIEHYYLKYNQDDERFVVALSSIGDDFECHACAPLLSFIEFKKQDNDGWIIGRKNIGIFREGSWGSPPSLKVMIIGTNNWGIVTQGGYTSTGIHSESTTIYANIAGTYQEVFSETTEEDHSGRGSVYELTSDISVRPVTGNPFYDLVLVKNIRSEEGEQSSEKIIYKFDGQRYSASSLK